MIEIQFEWLAMTLIKPYTTVQNICTQFDIWTGLTFYSGFVLAAINQINDFLFIIDVNTQQVHISFICELKSFANTEPVGTVAYHLKHCQPNDLKHSYSQKNHLEINTHVT